MKHIFADITALSDSLKCSLEKQTDDKSVSVAFVSHPDEFEKFTAGSVYFDDLSCCSAYPLRNRLYPKLREKGVQTAAFLPQSLIDSILAPEKCSEADLMNALDRISAAVSYCECIFAEKDKSLQDLRTLCEEMTVTCPLCEVLSEDMLLQKLCRLSKEEGTAEDVQLTQMVVLTARNDDIMKSLPYIEAYMPFVKELVICCPPQNVQPFREKYTGRLMLSFITDDELLDGAPLPEDHQARNFFLRCCLVRQDKLKNVFIMTDDDYRPMKPLTQEVFLKDGRYRGYYFYDLRDWQGTYNNYTSFDKGAFATRDFLLKEGYPTLQYSSHQPQVIDRRIFLEMLNTHNGIEKMPYDEWSTYFNFGFYRYPDKFLPCESVSMCWPGDLASWDINHVPKNYLFENYYEELYGEGKIFEGFSRDFCENTENENIEKARLYRESALRQMRERAVFEQYKQEYAQSTGRVPGAVVFYDDFSQKIRLSLPEYIRLAEDSWTRFSVSVDSQVYKKNADSDIFISYHYTNSLGVPVLNSPEIPIQTGDTRLMLPVRTPGAGLHCTVLSVRVTVKEKADSSHMGNGQTFTTEKSMKLMLVSTDEVDYV